MSRGPVRKSDALRQAQGLRSHKRKPKAKARVVDDQPAPVAVAPDPPPLIEPPSHVTPPKWLGKASRELWTAAAPAVWRKGLLTDADAIAFGRYCDWLAQYLELQKGTRRRRVVTETKSRHVKMQRMDKGFQALAIVDKRLTDYEDRFGMNPRERLLILQKLADMTDRRPPGPPAPTVPPPDKTGDRVDTPPAFTASPIGYLTGGRPN